MLIKYWHVPANRVVCHPWCVLVFSFLCYTLKNKVGSFIIWNRNLHLLKRIFNSCLFFARFYSILVILFPYISLPPENNLRYLFLFMELVYQANVLKSWESSKTLVLIGGEGGWLLRTCMSVGYIISHKCFFISALKPFMHQFCLETIHAPVLPSACKHFLYN